MFLVETPIWIALAISAAVGIFAGLYLKPTFRLRRFYKISDYLYSRFMPALLAPILWVSAQTTILINPHFLRRGEIGEALGRKRQ